MDRQWSIKQLKFKMKNKIFTLMFLCYTSFVSAQGLLDEISDDTKETNYTEATFKTTRLVNGHSVQTVGKGILDVKISHRFGTLNGGIYELFGLDNASMRMGVDYGITDRLDIGVGRSTFEKTYDGFAKYKILRQSTGAKKMPISLVYIGGVAYKTNRLPGTIYDSKPSTRFSYLHQLLIARKMSSALSLQLMPTLVHRNAVPTATDPNDLLAMGFGGRMKLSNRVSLNAEYHYQVNSIAGKTNPLSLGFDVETGGHVFQFHITNTQGMVEPSFINNTEGRWDKGDILFGFNIARVFTVVRPKGI
jgi:Membrane bound beta barrel domain (DUF5777)